MTQQTILRVVAKLLIPYILLFALVFGQLQANETHEATANNGYLAAGLDVKAIGSVHTACHSFAQGKCRVDFRRQFDEIGACRHKIFCVCEPGKSRDDISDTKVADLAAYGHDLATPFMTEVIG